MFTEYGPKLLFWSNINIAFNVVEYKTLTDRPARFFRDGFKLI